MLQVFNDTTLHMIFLLTMYYPYTINNEKCVE